MATIDAEIPVGKCRHWLTIIPSNSCNTILTIAEHFLVVCFSNFLPCQALPHFRVFFLCFGFPLYSLLCYPFHLDFSLTCTSTEKTFLTNLTKAGLLLLGSSSAPHLLLTLLSLARETIICIFVFLVPACLLHENGSFRKSDFVLTLFTTV